MTVSGFEKPRTSHDTVSEPLAFQFRERRYSHGAKSSSRVIRDKWLYVFYTRGDDTRYDVGSSEVKCRISDSCLGQHMAHPGRSPKHWPRATDEQAESFAGEYYFDDHGTIHPPPDAPAPDLPVPMDNYGQSLHLPLDGGVFRYFFLLSSFRLGAETVSRCMQEGAADGLSLWALREDLDTGKPMGFLRGPTQEDFDRLRSAMTPDETKHRIEKLRTIHVADPYAVAQDIHNWVLGPAVANYAQLARKLEKRNILNGKKGLPHAEEEAYRGTVSELHFIADVLSHYKYQVEHLVDMKKVRAVLKDVQDGYLSKRNGVENRAYHLVRWLKSPAHQLIDHAAAHDLDKMPQTAAVVSAHAFVLYHWYMVTSFLQMTSAGVAYLGSDAIQDGDNPVAVYLKTLKKHSNTGHARNEVRETVAIILLDLLARWHVGAVASKHRGSVTKRSAKATQAWVDGVNELGYLNPPLRVSGPADAKGPTIDKMKALVSAGGSAVAFPDKVKDSAELLEKAIAGFDRAKNPKQHSRHVAEAARFAEDGLQPSVKATIENEIKLKTLDVKSAATALFTMYNTLLGIGNVLFKHADNVWDVTDSVVGLSKDLSGAVEEVLGLAGIEKVAPVFGTVSDKTKETATSSQRLAKSLGRGLWWMGLLNIGLSVYSSISEQRKWRSDGRRPVVSPGAIAGFISANFAALQLLGRGLGRCTVVGSFIIEAMMWLYEKGEEISAKKPHTALEHFANHSWFSKTSANWREHGDRDTGGKDHWAGPYAAKKSFDPIDGTHYVSGGYDHPAWLNRGQKSNWPVEKQALALENILARASAKVSGRYDQLGDLPNLLTIELDWLHLDATSVSVKVYTLAADSKKKPGKLLEKFVFTPKSNGWWAVKSGGQTGIIAESGKSDSVRFRCYLSGHDLYTLQARFVSVRINRNHSKPAVVVGPMPGWYYDSGYGSKLAAESSRFDW